MVGEEINKKERHPSEGFLVLSIVGMVELIGEIPRHMLEEGRFASKITRQKSTAPEH